MMASPPPMPNVAAKAAIDVKIDVVEVSKVYETRGRPPVLALDDTSFRVAEKEFLSILGPSGCGKSTLLYMIAGFTTPTSGGNYSNENRTTQPSALRTKVFQIHHWFPWFTVAKNGPFEL